MDLDKVELERDPLIQASNRIRRRLESSGRRWNRSDGAGVHVADRPQRSRDETRHTFTVAIPESDDVVADVNAEAIEPSTLEVPRATEGAAEGDGPSTA